MTLDYSAPPVDSPPPTEVLIPEAKSRARRRRLALATFSLLAVATATTASFFFLNKPGRGVTPTTKMSAAAWAAAKTTCDHQKLSNYAGTPHLYGAYPTTVRLALNWPTKIYPHDEPVTPTTLHGGAQTAASNNGWPPGFNSSRPADICIFTGNFSYRTPSMQGLSLVQHAKVLLVYLMDIPPMNFSSASITTLNSIPRRPVPVAVSTP